MTDKELEKIWKELNPEGKPLSVSEHEFDRKNVVALGTTIKRSEKPYINGKYMYFVENSQAAGEEVNYAGKDPSDLLYTFNPFNAFDFALLTIKASDFNTLFPPNYVNSEQMYYDFFSSQALGKKYLLMEENYYSVLLAGESIMPEDKKETFVKNCTKLAIQNVRNGFNVSWKNFLNQDKKLFNEIKRLLSYKKEDLEKCKWIFFANRNREEEGPYMSPINTISTFKKYNLPTREEMDKEISIVNKMYKTAKDFYDKMSAEIEKRYEKEEKNLDILLGR